MPPFSWRTSQPSRAFIAKHFIQATLPHSNPGDALPAWKRTNGNLSLTVRPGWDSGRDCSYGYPYGTIPRLLLFWMTTEALHNKSPRLELGSFALLVPLVRLSRMPRRRSRDVDDAVSVVGAIPNSPGAGDFVLPLLQHLAANRSFREVSS